MKKKDILFSINNNYLGLWLILFFIQFGNVSTQAQDKFQKYSLSGKRIKLTSSAFGGTGVLCTKLNNQFTVMTGGRGSATFNNRYTFGGGGWGMPNGVEIESGKIDTYEFIKMGYGGLEFGYIIFPGNKFKLGTNLLLACGIAFKETIPKSDNEDFNMFPVLEPSIYAQIALGQTLRLDVGLTYRYITGANLSYIETTKLNSVSCYFAFLIGKCKCN